MSPCFYESTMSPDRPESAKSSRRLTSLKVDARFFLAPNFLFKRRSSRTSITALSRVRSFFVIARNSNFTYKGQSVGSVHRADARFSKGRRKRLTADLKTLSRRFGVELSL